MKFPYLTKKNFLKEKSVEFRENTSGDNFLIKDGALIGRDGLFTSEELIIEQDNSNDEIVKALTVQPEKIFVEGRECYIGYTVLSDYDSYQKANVYLIFARNEIKRIGSIYFQRVTDGVFYVPESILFYKARSLNGGGIYALSNLYNCDSGQGEKGYTIFEVSEDFSEWNRVSESDFYIPTIYYNGRGNRYGELPSSYNFEKPSELESRNLLTGLFYAYFSTDGLSYSFQLPLSEIENYSVVCDFTYKKGKTCSWCVQGGATSDTINVFDKEVTMHCNRKTGTITFSVDGVGYPLPMMDDGVQNNLKIHATKTLDSGLQRVCTSKGVLSTDSKILLFSNDNAAGEILLSSFENPLYFKKDTTLTVGDEAEEITALKNSGKTITAFKTDGIYKVDIKDGKQIAFNELISEVDKAFYEPEKLSVSPINRDIGTSFSKTVKYINGSFIFRADDSLYLIPESSGKTYKILDSLNEKTGDNYNDAFAFIFGEFYALSLGNKIYLADITSLKIADNVASVKWYSLSFPKEVLFLSAGDFEGEPVIFCSSLLSNINYIGCFKGDKDICLELSYYQPIFKNFDIFCSFKTDYLGLSSRKFEKLDLKVKNSAKMCISLLDESEREIFRDFIEVGKSEEKVKNITLYPSLRTSGASIQLVWKGNLSLLKFKVLYK